MDSLKQMMPYEAPPTLKPNIPLALLTPTMAHLPFTHSSLYIYILNVTQCGKLPTLLWHITILTDFSREMVY